MQQRSTTCQHAVLGCSNTELHDTDDGGGNIWESIPEVWLFQTDESEGGKVAGSV